MQVNADKEIKKVKLNHDSFAKTMFLFMSDSLLKDAFLEETYMAPFYRVCLFIEDRMSYILF